jgi:hypothetical protein
MVHRPSCAFEGIGRRPFHQAIGTVSLRQFLILVSHFICFFLSSQSTHHISLNGRIAMSTVRVFVFLCIATLVGAVVYAQTVPGTKASGTGKQVQTRVMSPLGTKHTAAAVPGRISYQGLLTTSAGSPSADGAYSLKFEIFDAVSAGNSLWNETQTGVAVSHGTFSVLLGSVTPLSNIFSKPLWLEVTAVSGPGIGSAVLFSPRVELASAAYSLGPWMSNADTLYTAQWKHVGINTASPETPLDVWAGDSPTIAKFSADGAMPLYLIANAPQIGFNIGYDYGFRYDNPGSGGTIAFGQQVDDGFSINTAPPGISGASSPLVSRIAVTNDGKVGIDTTEPNATLDVNGSLHVRDTANIGSSNRQGYLSVVTHPGTTAGLAVNEFGNGTQLLTYDDSNNVTIYLQPDINGQGGYLGVTRNQNQMGFEVDGNAYGTQSPRVNIFGKSKSITFYPDQPGDAAVQLPDSSIASHEILDGPGLTRTSAAGGVVAKAGVTNLSSSSITVPGPGYVFAIVSGYGSIGGDSVIGEVNFSVETSAATNPGGGPYAAYGAGNEKVTSPAYHWWPLHTDRIFSVASAGTYTYYLNANRVSTGGTAYLYNPGLTLLYFPKSYGTVSAMVPGSELAGFSSSQQASLPSGPSAAASGTPTSYVVDLRELELKATQARLEAERAERQLIEARMSANGGQANPQH